MTHIVIYGATSAIGQATARAFADEGAHFFLVGRDLARTDQVAQDLQSRGAQATACVLDVLDFDAHQATVEQARQSLGQVDIVLFCHGVLGDQAEAEKDYAAAERILQVNFLSVVSLGGMWANVLEEQGHGTLAAVSSVAGDRGRQSNYMYGTAKGAVSIFLSGLRNRLFNKGVHVCDIKPGFVSTPMTAHLDQGPLFADADKVGRQIKEAIRGRKDEAYVPGFWRPIMGAIRAVPEPLFKRMKL